MNSAPKTNPILDHTYNQYPVYQWQKGASSWLACPQWGAKLWQWTVQLAGNRQRPVIHWPDSLSDSVDYSRIRGGNPILFPFSGRTFHKGKIGYWQPEGTQSVLSMPMHGIAHSGQFEILNLDADGFHVRFLPTEEDRVNYPYQYDFEVVYRFEELAIQVDLILHNRDTQPIPWSAGHHFYFAVPWHSSGRREDYEITMDARKAFRHSPDGSLAPQEKPVFPFHTADPIANDRIHAKLKSNRVTLAPRNGEEPITIIAGESSPPDSGLAVVTWSESMEAPYICVEPWMGPPNSPEHKIGLHHVPSGETQRFHVEVRLD